MGFEPLPVGTGFLFENRSEGGSFPKEYVPAIRTGIVEAMNSGVVAGFPVVDFRAILLSGSHDSRESTELAFRIAASMAYRSGMEKAGPVILEPIMRIEILTPEDYLGELIADIGGRGGRILTVEDGFEGTVATAEVPLRSVFGYSGHLRSMTRGRATFTTQFREYREIPKAMEGELVKRVKTGVR